MNPLRLRRSLGVFAKRGSNVLSFCQGKRYPENDLAYGCSLGLPGTEKEVGASISRGSELALRGSALRTSPLEHPLRGSSICVSGVGAPMKQLLRTFWTALSGVLTSSPAIQLSKSLHQGWLVELFNLLYRVVTLHPTTPLAGELGPTRPGGGVAGTTWADVAVVDTCHSCHRLYRWRQVPSAHASDSSVNDAAISRSRRGSSPARAPAATPRRRPAHVATLLISRLNTVSPPGVLSDRWTCRRR